MRSYGFRTSNAEALRHCADAPRLDDAFAWDELGLENTGRVANGGYRDGAVLAPADAHAGGSGLDAERGMRHDLSAL